MGLLSFVKEINLGIKSSPTDDTANKISRRNFNRLNEEDEFTNGVYNDVFKKHNLNPLLYTSKRKRIILDCIARNLPLKYISDTEFTDGQAMQIKYGLESGIDVETYANPGITPEEMAEIRRREKRFR